MLRDLLRRAFRDRGYLIIFTAFFTCGFHMAIIETHLVSQMQHDGMTASGAAAGFAAYGVAAMIGPVIAGWLCGRFPMRIVLAGTYASRALIVAVFFALPTSSATLVGFAILLGLTGNSTVPPTSGIIEERFGAASLGTLFGAAFLCHQLGAFVSAWLGGVTATATGGYGLIWTLASVRPVDRGGRGRLVRPRAGLSSAGRPRARERGPTGAERACRRAPQAPSLSRSAARTGAAPERTRIERSAISRAVTACGSTDAKVASGLA